MNTNPESIPANAQAAYEAGLRDGCRAVADRARRRPELAVGTPECVCAYESGYKQGRHHPDLPVPTYKPNPDPLADVIDLAAAYRARRAARTEAVAA